MCCIVLEFLVFVIVGAQVHVSWAVFGTFGPLFTSRSFPSFCFHCCFFRPTPAPGCSNTVLADRLMLIFALKGGCGSILLLLYSTRFSPRMINQCAMVTGSMQRWSALFINTSPRPGEDEDEVKTSSTCHVTGALRGGRCCLSKIC
jgi:hypothetical protein